MTLGAVLMVYLIGIANVAITVCWFMMRNSENTVVALLEQKLHLLLELLHRIKS